MGDRHEMSLWRDMKHGHWVLYHPRLGEMEWVGEERDVPRGEERMKKTKLFVCRGCISGDVRSVVVESRKKEARSLGIKWNVQDGNVIGWPCVDAWMKEAREEWRKQVPESYAGTISDLDMDEAWELITQWKMTKEQFVEWLDQRAWDKANELTDEILDEAEAGVEAGWAEKSLAEVNETWARFIRRRDRGETWESMLPLDVDSNFGDEIKEEEEAPTSVDPAPTEDLVRVRVQVNEATVRYFNVPRSVAEEASSSEEEGEVADEADDEGSFTRAGYAYGRRVRFEEDEGGYFFPCPVLIGDLHEDDRRIQLAANLFKGLPIK